jgi:hypothetical protein
MSTVRTRSGVPIRLTDERWRHIASRHPEMISERERVLQTLADPDLLQAGDYGTLLAVRLFPATSLTSKHVIVVYRESGDTDGFVVTAYLTSRPSGRRKILWSR